jgi:hypothetical protein
MNLIFLSLVSTVVFGIIDALFFLFFEETAQSKIKKLLHISVDIAEIIVGALSAASAIFISSYVKMSLEEEVYLIKHPLLDASGILLGSIVVTSSYLFYTRVLQTHFFKQPFSNNLLGKG